MARDMRYADWSSQGQVPLSGCRRWLQSCVTHMNWEWGVMTSLGIFSWDWCPPQSIKPSILDSSPVFLRLQYCNSAPGTMHSIPETIWSSVVRMWLQYPIALFPNSQGGGTPALLKGDTGGRANWMRQFHCHEDKQAEY